MRKTCLFLVALLAWGAPTAFAISVDVKEFGLSKGEGLDEVKQPLGIAADGEGRLLLADKENKKLLMFSTDGKHQYSMPSLKSKKLERPTACAIGPGGAFYVVDESKKAVYLFNEAGERQSVGSKSHFAEPLAVAADDSGRVFVIDGKEKLLVGLSATGDRLSGCYQVQFEEPAAVAADRLGRAYVTDGKKEILFVFKADGSIERELSLGTGAAKGGVIKRPMGVAVNTHGEIFVLGAEDRKVFYKRGIDDPNWQVLFGGEGDGQGEFKKPVALAVAGRELVFVLDAEAPKIARAALGDLPALPPLGFSDLLSAQDTITLIPGVQVSYKEPQIIVSRIEPAAGRVYFSVLRPNGMPETGLRATDLQFSLDGRPISGVRIESFVDHSEAHLMAVIGLGTTKLVPLEMQSVKTAVVENFLADLVESKPDKAAILTYQNDISVPAHFTADPFRLKEELNKVGFSGDRLRFFDGILAGKDLIAQTDTTGFGALVYMLDARDEGSKYDIFQLEREVAEGNFPPVFVVGVGVAEGSQLGDELAKVAELTGGAYFFGPPLGENYVRIYRHVINRLEQQYVATFRGELTTGPVGISYVRADGSTVTTEAALKSPADQAEPQGREVMAPSGFSWVQWLLIILVILLAVLLVILLIRALVRKSRAVPAGWRLSARRGAVRNRHFDIRSTQTSLGSADNNDVVISDDKVSRNHAVLRWNGGRFEIEDLNSTNKTFVNGKPVTKAALKSGDLIGLAGVVDLVLEGSE